MEKIYAKTVEENGILEAFLLHQMHLTKRQVKQAKFRNNGILVNGRQQRVTANIFSGDLVEVKLEESEIKKADLIPLEKPLEILYEDEDVIVVNKPAGVVVHPSHGHYQDSLSNQLTYYFSLRKENVKIRSIGRLDKETSGIVLFAKNQPAAQRLSLQREQKLLRKEYLAFINGHLNHPHTTISAPIGKRKNDLIRMCVASDGKSAITHYTTEKILSDSTLIRLRLDTGRTHQIRVHMHYLGHPLLGDCLYGTPHPFFQRAALHACFLTFQQPFTGKTITITAPFPEDMKTFLENKEIQNDTDNF